MSTNKHVLEFWEIDATQHIYNNNNVAAAIEHKHNITQR